MYKNIYSYNENKKIMKYNVWTMNKCMNINNIIE